MFGEREEYRQEKIVFRRSDDGGEPSGNRLKSRNDKTSNSVQRRCE